MTGLFMAVMVLAPIPGQVAGWDQRTNRPIVFKNGKPYYNTDQNGNRIPDFSYCGYMAAENPIPVAKIAAVVEPPNGDATSLIQAAIDCVAALEPDANGIKGAVLLKKGTYLVSGTIKIQSSGVVLRGSGMGTDGTVLLGTGKTRDTIIQVKGKTDRTIGPYKQIVDPYVPVNATKISVPDPNGFRPGADVLVRRPCTAAWIRDLGMHQIGGGLDYLGWKEGSRELCWDRKIVAIEANRLILDAPLTMSLDDAYGGGQICTYSWPGRISHVGIENIHLRSEYDPNNPKDEDHRWMGITIEAVSDGWVRQVVFEHLAGSAVAIWDTAKRITVEDCMNIAPVSEIGGQRRYSFWTTGQEVLIQRVYSEYGYHDFAVGFCSAGPTAFVQCLAHRPYSFSGGVDSLACGVLFDLVNIDGHALSLGNIGPRSQGAGWNSANCVLWNCSASWIDCYSPPTACNWAFGSWAQFAGNGYWEQSNNHVEPRSLYYAQLKERLPKELPAEPDLMPFEGESSTSPSVEQAAELSRRARRPVMTIRDWIEQACTRRPIPTDYNYARVFDQGSLKALPPIQVKKALMQLQNGWLVCNGQVMVGSTISVPWWSGGVRPPDLARPSAHITRFVPGRYGPGLTDDLEELTEQMLQGHQVAIEHNYGLWYDRRRDDHERVRRIDGEVWPPFYEQPFVRSGVGTAFDGLSLYDLTKYNNWYWSRLKQFADLADQKGLVLIHHHYFQHNVLEAGAHWTDCPWRPANNINNTGFPEPVPYAGDKRIFLAEQFYDVNHPIRRPIHKAFIRKCLENFKEKHNVIHLIGLEFTGPVDFVRFWIDAICEWQLEAAKDPMVGISDTKDVQDAILSDPVRSSAVDIIDIRYWYYCGDGSLYAPAGGQNLAPRQHSRLLRPRPSSFEQVYRAVREYRTRFPGKAVIYSAGLQGQGAWAVFMAGGSLAPIPKLGISGLLSAAISMRPVDIKGGFALADDKGNYILYADQKGPILLDISHPKKAVFIGPADGVLIQEQTLAPGQPIICPQVPVVIWVKDQTSD